jgi:hypothetical protein
MRDPLYLHPDPIWNEDPERALAEVESRIRLTGRSYIRTGQFRALEQLPRNIAEAMDDQINLSYTRIRDISGLCGVKGLRQLTLPEHVTDISVLADLKELEGIDFFRWEVADILPLAACNSLKRIENLRGDCVDLAVLGQVRNLEFLSLSMAKGQSLPAMPRLTILFPTVWKAEEFTVDLGVLASSANLKTLMSGGIRGCNPPRHLDKLESFAMSLTDQSDFDTVARYAALVELSVSATAIHDLSAIPLDARLREINLSGSQIRDIRRLAALKHLQELDISRTPVEDIVPLSFCPQIKQLNAAGTQVTSLAGWNPKAYFYRLDVSDTGVSSIGPLVGTTLHGLSAKNTPLSDLRGFSGIKGLSRLDISGTKVAEIPPEDADAAVLNIEQPQYDPRDQMWFHFTDTPLAAKGWKPKAQEAKAGHPKSTSSKSASWKGMFSYFRRRG